MRFFILIILLIGSAPAWAICRPDQDKGPPPFQQTCTSFMRGECELQNKRWLDEWNNCIDWKRIARMPSRPRSRLQELEDRVDDLEVKIRNQ